MPLRYLRVEAQIPSCSNPLLESSGSCSSLVKALLACLQLTRSLLANTGIPGKAKNEDVVQKNVLSSSLTKVQEGSVFHAGRIGFVYYCCLGFWLQATWQTAKPQAS